MIDLNRQTDRMIDWQTDRTKNITFPYFLAVGKYNKGKKWLPQIVNFVVLVV